VFGLITIVEKGERKIVNVVDHTFVQVEPEEYQDSKERRKRQWSRKIYLRKKHQKTP